MGLFGKLFKSAATNVVKSSLNNAGLDCPNCGAFAKYDEINDEFICPKCGINVLEYDEDDEYEDYDDDDEMPEGCAACGGPYPKCTSSCKLFDD